MNKKVFFNLAAILSMLCVLQVLNAAAQTYQVIIYNSPSGFSDTEGEGLGGQQRVGAGRISGSTSPEDTHAFLWTGDSIAPLDLHPSNYTYSRAYDTDGARQVGYVELNLFPQIDRRAALWSGSASSLIVLSNRFSEALAIGGDQQVGYVNESFTCSECGTTTSEYAALWRGTSQSLVNLHPRLLGCKISRANDTDGAQQVGDCFFQIPQQTSNYRAMLWSGTAQSVVVLHPANYFNSYARAVKNGVQVGFGNTGTFPNLNPSDALVWRGTAQSVVVLGRGIAEDTNGTTHVGAVESTNGNSNAFRWDGDSGAGFNLHTLLPAGVYQNSYANEIDEAGNIIGSAQLPNGRLVGVLWRAANSNNRTAPKYDFDGDGKSDVSVYRNGTWYMQESRDGFRAAQFGFASDKIVPADFDGDGKTDIATFRDGVWYWLNSSNGSFNSYQFGIASDIPVPADYTGDGRTELAVYRAGVWYTLNLVNSQFNVVQFGISTDKPVPADFDADGKIDFAVYRDGTWYLLRSTAGFTAVQFGIASDKPTVGDYDGDGKADQAVYRSGIWYVLGSTQGFYALQFGVASDIPVAADYDGDGKTDVAVFREGVWYLLRSQQGFGALQFGAANDKPIPAAFVP